MDCTKLPCRLFSGPLFIMHECIFSHFPVVYEHQPDYFILAFWTEAQIYRIRAKTVRTSCFTYNITNEITCRILSSNASNISSRHGHHFFPTIFSLTLLFCPLKKRSAVTRVLTKMQIALSGILILLTMQFAYRI